MQIPFRRKSPRKRYEKEVNKIHGYLVDTIRKLGASLRYANQVLKDLNKIIDDLKIQRGEYNHIAQSDESIRERVKALENTEKQLLHDFQQGEQVDQVYLRQLTGVVESVEEIERFLEQRAGALNYRDIRNIRERLVEIQERVGQLRTAERGLLRIFTRYLEHHSRHKKYVSDMQAKLRLQEGQA